MGSLMMWLAYPIDEPLVIPEWTPEDAADVRWGEALRAMAERLAPVWAVR